MDVVKVKLPRKKPRTKEKAWAMKRIKAYLQRRLKAPVKLHPSVSQAVFSRSRVPTKISLLLEKEGESYVAKAVGWQSSKPPTLETPSQASTSS